MPSPIRPSDIAATVPGQTSDFCTKFKLVLLQLPNLLNQFFGWALKSDGSISDALKTEVNPFAPGDVKWTFSATTPSGWLKCEGQTISRLTYAALFNSIGTIFGPGDGSTTFNLPDGRNRVLLGVSPTKNLASTGGEDTHKLTIDEMPAHTHVLQFTGIQVKFPDITAVVQTVGSGAGSTNVNSAGGDGSHNNLQPYIAAYLLIKT